MFSVMFVFLNKFLSLHILGLLFHLAISTNLSYCHTIFVYLNVSTGTFLMTSGLEEEMR